MTKKKKTALSRSMIATISSFKNIKNSRYGENGLGRTGGRIPAPITLPNAEAFARFGIGTAAKEADDA